MGLPRRRALWRYSTASTIGVACAALLASPGCAATTGPTLTVDATANVHAIPGTIYGVNWASQTMRTTLRLPVNRWGGNESSLYNYTNNAYNNGNDWYFENQIGQDTNHRLSNWVASNRSTATPSLVDVPMIGYVANGSKPNACAYSIAKYGAQQANDWQWRPDCGNGVLTNGQRITNNTRTDIATAVNPASWATAMVQSLVSAYGTAANGGVRYYGLDNEPGLWSETHRSVHPNPLTHTEWWNKAVAVAAAIKAVDSSAAIMGPSDDGYCRWLYDAADDCDPNGVNHQQTGDLAPWYVKQFKAYADANHGRRLLHYLDEHYYPSSPNGSPAIALAPSGSSATQARRLRSTRSLWDPTWKDESWIGGVNDVNAPPLQFIRTMRTWAALYPGTKTAISEYNWGGFDSINGALAQADVLGIFGRERLDLATLWNYANELDGSWAEWAFRMYRNYDGNGARFGSTGVSAISGDQGKLSIYASTGSTYLTAIVINKTTGALTSPVQVNNFPHTSTGRIYTLGPSSKSIAQKSAAVGASGLAAYTFPAQSVTLIRIAHS